MFSGRHDKATRSSWCWCWKDSNSERNQKQTCPRMALDSNLFAMKVSETFGGMANRCGGGEAPSWSPLYHCRHGFQPCVAPTTTTWQVVSWSRSGFIATSTRPRVQLLSAGGLSVPWISGPDLSVPRQGPVIRSDDCHAKRAGMNSPSPCKLVVQVLARRKARCLGSDSAGNNTILWIH